ncbi:MAG TPA: GAF domain-containing protein [Candidatus Baltobacteraceae bacterium]|nr:GAF domain-containing protein [Candidatus Baltobacteraceae bacterium]
MRNTRWKWFLLVLCGLSLVVVAAYTADEFGVGGRPWYGWWDSNVAMTARPYVVSITGTVPGGATFRAGLRNGDLVDLREQPLNVRVALVSQLMATRPTRVIAHRDAQRIVADVTGSTMFEGDVVPKVLARLTPIVSMLWFIGCALAITLRRWSVREGRILVIVLLWPVAFQLQGGNMVVPSAALAACIDVFAVAVEVVALLLLMQLASGFGVRYPWRAPLEWAARFLVVLEGARNLIGLLGVSTLWFDPLPYLAPEVLAHGAYATAWTAVLGIACIAVAVVAGAAVIASPTTERPRVAWLTLPLSCAIAVVGIARSLLALAPSWLLFTGLVGFYNLVWLLAALVTTYALLKRRVLDFEFVLSRTIVVGTLSLIVVAAFALLEWLLSSVLVGVGHLTGLIANAALALVLGVSLNYLHKSIDGIIEGLLFRKRRDDERALREFAKEATFVTDVGALLDQTILRIKHHTDATSASVLLDDEGSFTPVRSFGESVPEGVSENDGAILALKSRHEPLDPHHCETALTGALAVPMLAHGRLLGLLLLGERYRGEAYTPDEVEALAQLAQGVGSALDVLFVHEHMRGATLSDEISALREAIVGLPDAIALRLARERIP